MKPITHIAFLFAIGTAWYWYGAGKSWLVLAGAVLVSAVAVYLAICDRDAS